MTDKLDTFVEELQNQIYEETRETFGEKVYRRWREPLYMGAMDNPDGHANLRGTCGDSIELFLRIADDRITAASFLTDGCSTSIVCGSYAAEMALGKTVDEISAISGEAILEALGGLPEENEHCAYLAAASLQAALDSYMRKK